jgi:hypothetical protein
MTPETRDASLLAGIESTDSGDATDHSPGNGCDANDDAPQAPKEYEVSNEARKTTQDAYKP